MNVPKFVPETLHTLKLTPMRFPSPTQFLYHRIAFSIPHSPVGIVAHAVSLCGVCQILRIVYESEVQQ